MLQDLNLFLFIILTFELPTFVLHLHHTIYTADIMDKLINAGKEFLQDQGKDDNRNGS